MELGSLVIADFTDKKVYGNEECHQEKQDVSAWLDRSIANCSLRLVKTSHSDGELTIPETAVPTVIPNL